MNLKQLNRHISSIVFSILLLAGSMAAQGNAFSFQGRLNDGTNPANGSYDLQFRLFNSITGGSPIGTAAERPNTTLINGVFSVTLDFGASAFNNPNAVFIEIAVKPNGSPNAFTILGPRQQLTVVPFAVRAQTATNADNATNAQNATNAANASALNGLSSSDFIRNSVAPIANQNFNIVGNGVINGTLNIAGETTVGSPTITSNLNVSGNITAAGNAAQNRNSNGLVKAMIFVNSEGGTGATIIRCYNGVTGATTGNCGFTVQDTFFGKYVIDFGFQVTDRFYSVTTQQNQNIDSGSNISTGFWFPGSPNQLGVKTNITDVDFPNSFVRSPFMVIVY